MLINFYFVTFVYVSQTLLRRGKSAQKLFDRTVSILSTHIFIACKCLRAKLNLNRKFVNVYYFDIALN